MHNSTKVRIRLINQITLAHYEDGNQSRCYKAIWRKYIRPQFGVCYRTYLNYLNTPVEPDNTMKKLRYNTPKRAII